MDVILPFIVFAVAIFCAAAIIKNHLDKKERLKRSRAAKGLRLVNGRWIYQTKCIVLSNEEEILIYGDGILLPIDDDFLEIKETLRLPSPPNGRKIDNIKPLLLKGEPTLLRYELSEKEGKPLLHYEVHSIRKPVELRFEVEYTQQED